MQGKPLRLPSSEGPGVGKKDSGLTTHDAGKKAEIREVEEVEEVEGVEEESG